MKMEKKTRKRKFVVHFAFQIVTNLSKTYILICVNPSPKSPLHYFSRLLNMLPYIQGLIYSSNNWQKTLCKFQPIKNNRDKIAMEPYPNDKVLATFANLAYSDCTGELELPGDWSLLTTAKNGSLMGQIFIGYFGTAFWSPSLQQIVIAHRGTILSELGATWTDGKGVFCNCYTNHMCSAITFAEDVKEEIQKINKEHHSHFVLSFTGHSLGAWLAGVTTLTVKYLKRKEKGFCRIVSPEEGLHAHTLALDSPGVEDMLIKIRRDFDDRYNPSMFIDQIDITNILSDPNMVNSTGFHVGDIQHIPMKDFDFSSDSKKATLFYNLDAHDLKPLIKAIGDERVRYVVENWPQGLAERRTYQELMKQKETKDGTDPSSKNYRYNIWLRNTCHLGVFSMEELKFVKNMSFFRSNTISNLSETENFLSSINIDQSDFSEIKINVRSKTITCDSKTGDLEKVIRQIKQLFRWFAKEIMDAVNKQNESIKTAPLYLTGQAYLRSLPDILNCEDTLELNKFLENSKQHVLQIETSDTKFEAARLNNILLNTEITDLNKRYLKDDNCHTSLSWNNLTDIAKKIDIEALNKRSVTINNLLILEIASPTDNSLPNDAFKKLLTNLDECSLKKLIVILPQQNNNQLFKDFTLTVVTRSFKAFELSDLTPDSREQILARDVMALGEETMSLKRLLGNNNNTANEQLNNLLNQFTSPIFKNLATNKWRVETIEYKLPRLYELDAFYSKGKKLMDKAKLTALLERSGDDGPLLVFGDPDQRSQDCWGEVAEVEQRKIFISKGDGQDLFLDKCRKEPARIIYWFHLSAEGFSLNEVHNKSIYIDRKFHSRVIIKFIKEFVRYSGSKDLFIFKNATDKKELIRPFGLSWEDQRTFVSKDHFKVDCGDIIIEESFSKHYFELDWIEKKPYLVWQYSKGSLDGLRPFIEIDYSKSTEENDFCKKRNKLVIIADDPGMGKTTSLTRMSEFIRDSWVLRIDHKLLDSATAKLPPKLTLQSVTNCLIHASGLPTKNKLLCSVLRHCLETENSMHICVLVDAFDEITKEKTKVETVKFLKYLKTATTCETVITTRLYTQEWLENDLAEFAAEFKKITEVEQEDYLAKFWLPHLALEHAEHGEAVNGKLLKFARGLRVEVENILRKDVARFMGIPLQIRMLAEVFLQQAIQSVVSPEQAQNLCKITNLYDLYTLFINVKKTICFEQKINVTVGRIKTEEYMMKKHRVLAFKAIDPTFATEYFKNVKLSKQELEEISCLGLIRFKTAENFSFIHRTFQEYFCADFFVRWLRPMEKNRTDKNTLVMKELSKFLLRPEYRISRMFIETQLQTMHKLGDALENHPVIYQHWFKDHQLVFNDHDKTPLHIAADEQNLHTFAVLLGGPDSRISDQAYISFIAARDKTGKTALNIAMENRNTNMVNKLIENVNSCSYESLLELMLATFLDTGGNRNDGDSDSDSDSNSDSDSDRDGNSDDNNGNNYNRIEALYIKECFPNTPQMTKVNQALKRVQRIRNVMLKLFIAAVRKDHNDTVLGIWRNMKNDTERNYLLIAIDSRGNTAINLATRKQDHILFKEFAKRGVCVSYDKAGQNPLHCAADQGYITIVNYLLNQSKETHKNINSMYNEDEEIILKQFSSINSQDKGGNTALMLASRGGYNDVVRKLLDSGADVNSADSDGSTAMMLAAENNHPEIVNVLVNSRENINFANKYGNTALMLAAMKESRKAMRALLEKGANVNSANNDGDTALIYAAGRGYHKVVRILLKAKADMNHQNKTEETALFRAVTYGHLAVVKLLLKFNTNILSQDNSWRAAAEESEHSELVDFLNCQQRAITDENP